MLDNANGMCYQIIGNLNDFENGKSACQNLNARLVQFDSDAQVTGFIALLKAGNFFCPFPRQSFRAGLKKG